ncbi:MAG: Mce-associated rane protein [Mycobacterium sp.]|nr:Mce-associated rane protein [Mycobacterium sp.]
MPSRKRASSMLNGGAHDEPNGSEAVADSDDALALAEEAEAEAAAAEAAAAAARARARALKLRRQAEAAATADASPVQAVDLRKTEVAEPEVVETEPETEPETEDAHEPETAEPSAVPRRGRPKLPPIRLKWVAAALVIIFTVGFLGASAFMFWHHRQATEEQQRSAEFAAAARQGVVTLMSLNFNNAADDVKRIIDNTTGDFKKDFQGQADEFTKVAQESKVITEATVNATAVQAMSKDTATVLVAVTTQVSNVASKQQEPRSWRLRVNLARDGGQLKLAKVEFVP